MPRGDGTGPMGQGAMTGRAAGYCGGHGVPGYANATPGRGAGRRGRFGGHGRGMRNRYYATGLPGWARYGMPPGPPVVPFGVEPPVGAPVDETSALREQAEYLTDALEEVRTRLAELETKPEE